MGFREFPDAKGRRWRAWDIRPEAIHPVTKAEDYLADCYVTGWIVFETVSGDEKRRLCPWPMRWMDGTEEQLRELLARAEVVPPHRRAEGAKSGAFAFQQTVAAALDKPDDLDITDLQIVRTFKYPGGRYWTVGTVMLPEDGGPPVLRFTAGLRSIDLRSWPKDWADQPDHELVTMLRRAAPRRISGPVAAGVPARRWDDQPEAAP